MQEERRSEILGILTIALSVFVFVSLVGYNSNEEPSISSNVQVINPMGILGVYVAHVSIKLGFGFLSIIIPLLGIGWGWFLFAKKEINEILRITYYGIGSMMLGSIMVGTLIIQISPTIDDQNWIYSGMLGAQLANLFIDWLSIWGTSLFLFAGILVLIRGYFNLDYYSPIINLKEKILKWKTQKNLEKEEKEKVETKRKHTQELKEKIDAQKQREAFEFDQEDIEELVESDIDKEALSDIQSDEVINDQPSPSQEQIDKDDDGHDIHDNPKKIDSLDKANDERSLQDDATLNIEDMAQTEEVDIDEVVERKVPKKKYILPSSDLLDNPVNISDSLSRDELVERANYLTQSLATYGVDGQVVNVHPGPIITLFEVEPAEGVRVNKFVQLADDLARVMEASSVRVIAPIPGKSSVGIEIPNRNPATVFFKSVVNSPEFAEAESMLTLAVGKTTSGEISCLDLSKMPHLLIAGTTGSGKSVCINTIICSILYRATPDEVKFVMIDPKKVEMTLYRKLEGYHLLKMEDIPEPIVTSVDNSILALRALEKEMDRRYNVLADALVRNIGEYNEKMQKINEPIMPYIVLIVDELADLMMLSAKDVEAPIARLAQLARAVGIHLVIATQRPSVDVITGVIKANFPSRIAFQVASKIDSRTIIDQPGADKLIGRGDLLHLGTGSSDVFRMHNAFLSLDEIESLMNHVSSQPKADELILPSVRESQVTEFGVDNKGGQDELFNEAVALVITHQQGSISLLQRRLKVGYSRAARLIDDMEQVGVVGPFTGSKAREVLVDESYLEMIKD